MGITVERRAYNGDKISCVVCVLYIHVVEMRLYSKLPPYRADPKSSYNLS